MRILWNDREQYFEAELTPGDLWREDMESAKSAGFKTTGPPGWQWHTSKASVLNKLRENRPKSGLTLTEVALEKYKEINEREEKKAEIKKAFEQAKKAAKKVSKDPEISGTTELVIPEGKFWISREDLPPWEPKCVVAKIVSFPHDICFICEAEVYFYEKTSPTPICMWCAKEVNSA